MSTRGPQRAVRIVGVAIGAPHCAMTASPMNLSSVPPCSKITSTISREVLAQELAISSGPIDSAIAVKPRMSLKSTAVGRRSPPSRMASSCCAIRRRRWGRSSARSWSARRLAPDLLGVAAVLDPDRGEAAERHQELQVLVGEGVRGVEIVDVEQAEHAVAGRHERGAHRAPHALQQDRLAAEAGIRRRVLRDHGDLLLHDLVGDRARDRLHGWASPRRLREIVGHELAGLLVPQQDGDAVDRS